MRSVMSNSFNSVARANTPRSHFNRSHGLKTTFDCDYLYPILVDDIIPGDTFNVNCHFFCRLATPEFPIMDNMYLETFFFFVPYRLVWDNFKKMHGEQVDPADSIDYSVPALRNTTTEDLTNATVFDYLCDYMGLPHKASVDISEISALPFRAYNLIYNEWFRDQNMQDSRNVPTDDGPDGGHADYEILKRGKRHDYFTACLPWPQKGDAVTVSLGTRANVTFDGDRATGYNAGAYSDADAAWATFKTAAADATLGTGTVNANGQLYADLSAATGLNINDIRLAFQTQRLLERDARAGTRYNEHILAHYGVVVPDFRVQRPEFLGGGSSPINVTPVAQTTYQGTPTAEDGKGSLAAFGTVSGRHGFTKSFVEHGVLIGLVNVRGDITYSQGLERYWSKSTRYDFYYPELAHIGEQAVLNKEIWYNNDANDDLVFGYIPRYEEYRFKPSRLTSLMRPDNAASLSAWHLSEDFASLPSLGDTFIRSNTGVPLDRCIQVPTEPQFIGDFYFDMKCARPLPLFGTPGNLDRL